MPNTTPSPTICENPSILDFEDYRDFLAARFRYLKTIKKNFSYAIAAHKTNVAQSYYKNLFRKDRHLGLENLGRVSKALELSVTEELFLLFKLIAQTVQDPQISEICRKNLGALTMELKFQKEQHTKTIQNHGELDKDLVPLYFYAIMHLCDWPDFSPTVPWVKSRLFTNDLSDEALNKHILKAKELHESMKSEGQSIAGIRIAPLSSGQVVRTKQLFHGILPGILNMENYHAKVHNYAEHNELFNISQEGLKEVADLFYETREKLRLIHEKHASEKITRTLFWSHSVYNLAREEASQHS